MTTCVNLKSDYDIIFYYAATWWWREGRSSSSRGGGGGAQTVSHDDKPVKCPVNPTGYDKDLVEALERDIIQTNPNVKW